MGMRENSELAWRLAIDNAYDVFADYRRPGTLDASPAEDVPILLANLTSAPLRLLPPEKLDNFAASALYTVGSEMDYKHFLPRILELMVGAPEYGFDPDLTAGKLCYADLRNWPSDEADAVRQVFIAAWQRTSQSHSASHDLPRLIVANALVGNDISTLLHGFDTLESSDVVVNLASLVREITEQTGKISWPWSQLQEADMAYLRDWSASEVVAQHLMEGIDLVEGEDAWDVEVTLQVLGRI